MYCPHCGASMDEHANFCPACEKPAQPVPGAAPPAKPKNKKPLFIAAAGGLVLVLLAALLLPPLFSSPLSRIIAARQKTLEAFAAQENFGLFQLFSQLGEKPMEQEARLSVEDFGDSLPPGVSLGLLMQTDYRAGQMALQADVSGGAATLLSAGLEADGGLLSLAVPALFQNTYGVNTGTLGQDFNRSPLAAMLNLALPEDYSPRLFGGAGALGIAVTAETRLAITARAGELLAQLEIRRAQGGETPVNGRPLRCTRYPLLLPGDALQAFAQEGWALLAEDSSFKGAAAVAAAYAHRYGQLVETVSNRLATLSFGDVSGSVYLHNGYLVKVELEGLFDDVRYGLLIAAGDESGITGALTVEATADLNRLSFTQTALRNTQAGSYESNAALRYNGLNIAALALSYHSAQPTGNFSLQGHAGEGGSRRQVSADGTLTLDARAGQLDFDMEHLRLVDPTGKEIALYGSYSLRPISAVRLGGAPPVMVLNLSQNELDTLRREMTNNVFKLIFPGFAW